jgi:hypothetical protein
VRKAIERVFGILKKRFRILKIPLPCYNLSQIVDIIVRVDFKDEGIMYTVRHVTDNFTHDAHISDFVAMGDGSYPRMKQVAKADALAHKAWLRIMDEF